MDKRKKEQKQQKKCENKTQYTSRLKEKHLEFKCATRN